jgi:hypothetical protein
MRQMMKNKMTMKQNQQVLPALSPPHVSDNMSRSGGINNG